MSISKLWGRAAASWHATSRLGSVGVARARQSTAATSAAALATALAISVIAADLNTTYGLAYSTVSSRVSAVPLAGATTSGSIYVVATPVTSDIVRVKFWLNDQDMAGTPRQTENTAPYDFAGGSASLANPFDTTVLPDGSHTITTRVEFTNGTFKVFDTTFSVDNEREETGTSEAPDQIHLSWTGDTATTMTVLWRTMGTSLTSEVSYRAFGTTAWNTLLASRRPSGTRGSLYHATLTALSPDTAYEYRVLGQGGTWSDVHQFRTAPGPGPADFSVAFVADTGLIGRADGLTTGTAQVRDEIARLKPTLTLTGGDYIYYNTDKRYGSLDDSIDVWFNQMQPIAASSPIMPTYGNHEALLGEGLSYWFARFAHPTGYDGQRFYSFDVADVHFVSILAVSDTAGIPSGALTWIDQDMASARARGQRWIVPYFHAVPFGDGTNHKSNPELRRQFGPVFEKHGVKIALYTHDQAYERSYPMVDVPATNTITSTNLRCYGASDGVTWVKTSPGGKMSNISGGFSPFAHAVPPSWTAYRNNTIHNFGRLLFSSSGTATYEAYGVTGDGTAPALIDKFEYRLDSACPAALRFEPAEASFSVNEGGTAGAAVTLRVPTQHSGSVTLSENAPWLSVAPTTTSASTNIQLTVTAKGLVPGTYSAIVTATSPDLIDGFLSVTMSVTGEYKVYVSASADRPAPAVLAGATVSDDVFIFTLPTQAVTKVEFYLDNPSMSGTPYKTEGNAPHDFAGTKSDGSAYPFNTNTLADGRHVVSARLTLSGGTSVATQAEFTVANSAPPAPALAISPGLLLFSASSGATPPAQALSVSSSDGSPASFTATANVAWVSLAQSATATPAILTVTVNPAGLVPGTHNGMISVSSLTHGNATVPVTLTIGGPSPEPGTYGLLYSLNSNRSDARQLEGATVAGRIYVFSSPDSEDIDRVAFWLDNTAMSGSPRRSEATPPYDFVGGSASTATAWDTRKVSNASHTISTRVYFVNGTSVTFHTTFTVSN